MVVPLQFVLSVGCVEGRFPQDERSSMLPEANCRPSQPIIFPISLKEIYQ